MNNLFQEVEVNSSPPKRLVIFLLPFSLLLFLACLFFWVGRDAFIYSQRVDVVKVRLAQGNAIVTKKTNRVIFQAAGWIEAQPYSTRITALVSGFVKKIYVIAGQKVKKGQLLAELIDEDLLLLLRQTKATLQELKARRRTKKILHTIEVANKERLFFEKMTAIATLNLLKHRDQLLNLSRTGIAKLEKEQATLLVKEQFTKIKVFSANKKIIIEKIKLAQAEIAEVDQQIKRQKVQIDKVNLDIKRLHIVAPQDGIIQHLYVREGRKQFLEADNEMSTTIAEMYNPRYLQVRVDVPLYDIPAVKIGQQTLISVEASKQALTGVVTILGGQADYQKNTLQVKVYVDNPPDILRPEMLAQVKFLQDTKVEKRSIGKALFVRNDCVYGDVKDQYVWVVSLENHLQKRKIKHMGEQDGWIVVTDGLSAGERVVVGNKNNLKLGDIVQIGRLYE